MISIAKISPTSIYSSFLSFIPLFHSSTTTTISEHIFIYTLSTYRGFTYYKMSNLDNRISNPDQLLTQDVEKFCDSVVELYSNISKPILDILIYVRKLTQAIGGQVRGWMKGRFSSVG